MHNLKQIGSRDICTSAVIVKDGKLLLGLRHYTPDKWQTISVWTTPGGRCDDGEVVEDNIRRETMEEVGITDLEITQFLGEFPGAKEGDTVLVFKCSTNQKPVLKEPEKFSEWRWFEQVPDNFINADMAMLLKSMGF